ncbi:MAG: hypothetical protein R2761_17465 [Acidimicrobiales bacterium]
MALSIAAGAVAGAIAGFAWGGVGGRVAMRVLFLTSDEAVRGLTSDDGFEIGRISPDSIFLLLAMTVVGGVLGAAYGLVRMLFRAPSWMVSGGIATALGAGAGGGLIVRPDGVDFQLLEPLWLAVALFVFLPAVWGLSVGLATERLLHIKLTSASRLPDTDVRPLGLLGDILGWSSLAVITLIGLRDLLHDLARLS